MSNEHKRRKRALVSVTDKGGLEELKLLVELGWEFVSTDGTAKRLEELGIPVTSIEQVTGFPEMLDGRIKTLHPNIFGGILANRDKQAHLLAIAEHGIQLFDLVVVNLYNFSGKPSIETIDIGGPALLRAAAKNWQGGVTAVCDPEDYVNVVQTIKDFGEVPELLRHILARKVFYLTAGYDTVIADLWPHL